jgi:hypothetical protein
MNYRKLMAFHEAGHAVIARKLGINVNRVVLSSATGSFVDAVAMKSNTDFKDKSVIEGNAKAVIAGPIAQQCAFPGSVTEKDIDSDLNLAGKFVLYAVHLAAGIAPPKGDFEPSADIAAAASDLMARLEDETQILVGEHWPAIKRVAEALTRRDILNQDELDALIA